MQLKMDSSHTRYSWRWGYKRADVRALFSEGQRRHDPSIKRMLVPYRRSVSSAISGVSSTAVSPPQPPRKPMGCVSVLAVPGRHRARAGQRPALHGRGTAIRSTPECDGTPPPAASWRALQEKSPSPTAPCRVDAAIYAISETF